MAEKEERNSMAEDLKQTISALNEIFKGKPIDDLLAETDFSAQAETDRLKANTKLFNDSIAPLMKTMQQKRPEPEEIPLVAEALRLLIVLATRRTIYEVFKLLSVNNDLVQNFNRVFELCRPAFELRIPVGDRRMCAATHVLQTQLSYALGQKDENAVKKLCVLIRQLTRSNAKIVDSEVVITQRSVVSTTDLIRDVLFALPLNVTNCELILNLLNHLFSTGSDARLHVIDWATEENGRTIKPAELLAFMLLVYKQLRSESPSRVGFPLVFRQFGNKLQKDQVVILADDLPFIETELNTWLWPYKFALAKWLQPMAPTFETEVPEILVRFMRLESRRAYRKVHLPMSRGEVAPVDDYCIAVLELAFVQPDLARELLKEMREVICFPDTDPTTLRLNFMNALMSYTAESLSVENYRNVVPVIEDLIRQHNWPLELTENIRVTPLTTKIAIKNELLSLLGITPLLAVAVSMHQPAEGGGDASTSTSVSAPALANCFATESYRTLSELFNANVEEQTNTRTRQCHTSTDLIDALRRTFLNVRSLALKLSHTPLRSDLIVNCVNGVDELLQRLEAAAKTIDTNWSLEADEKKRTADSLVET